jgi:hypothetical protein
MPQPSLRSDLGTLFLALGIKLIEEPQVELLPFSAVGYNSYGGFGGSR